MLDLLTGNLEIATKDLSLPGVDNSLVVEPATTGAFPAITSQAGGNPVVYYLSTSNSSGNNAVGNAEIYYAFP
jgi:hypothetical protein